MDFSFLWAHRSLICAIEPRYSSLILSHLPESFIFLFTMKQKPLEPKLWKQIRWYYNTGLFSFPRIHDIYIMPVWYVHISGLWRLQENITWSFLLRSKWEAATHLRHGIWLAVGVLECQTVEFELYLVDTWGAMNLCRWKWCEEALGLDRLIWKQWARAGWSQTTGVRQGAVAVVRMPWASSQSELGTLSKGKGWVEKCQGGRQARTQG